MAGVLVAAHKQLKCFAEAMVDSYSVFHGVDYSLTLALFTFALESSKRMVILACVSFALCIAFVVTFLTDAVTVFSKRETHVSVATYVIIVTQIVATAVSVSQLALKPDPFRDYPSPGRSGKIAKGPTQKLRAFVIVWWRANIGKIRHSAAKMLIGFVLIWTLLEGPLKALSWGIETLIYLNVPNLVGFTCLSCVVSIIRTTHGWRWLSCRPQYKKPILILVLPYSLAWLYTMVFFECSVGVTVMTIFAVWTLTGHAIDICREHEVSESGPVSWRFVDKEGNVDRHVPVGLACHLEDAVLRAHRTPALVSMEHKCDISKMTIQSRGEPDVKRLKRVVRSNPSAASPPGLRTLLSQFLPRLLLMQSRTSFNGSRFNRTRIILKCFTALIAGVIASLVVGAVVQETVAILQPVDVGLLRRPSHDNGSEEVVVQHLVADLHFVFNSSSEALNVNSSRVSGQGDGYGQLCQRSHHGIDMFEMALMSVGPYLNNASSVARFVDSVNVGLSSDWEVMFPRIGDPGPSRAPRSPWKSIVEVHSRQRNTTLVAIRGTDPTSMFDMLQDVSIYVESFLYQLMTHILPAAHLVPTSLICDAIGLASALEAYTVPWVDRRDASSTSSHHFHDIVIDHVHAIDSARRPRVAFVGHSLGGAIGHIAAARTGLHSFGIQSPGIVLPRKKLGLATSQIHRATTTVAISHDIVPLIGWQAGDVLHAECTDRIRERCHIAEQVVAAIWQNCESVRKRHPRLTDVWVA
uniref:Fungal lipase-like domain-containing protein n=1 Tax=Neobodo designis TaxID=312471 RepID=A0A7S1LUC9_NEODS